MDLLSSIMLQLCDMDGAMEYTYFGDNTKNWFGINDPMLSSSSPPLPPFEILKKGCTPSDDPFSGLDSDDDRIYAELGQASLDVHQEGPGDGFFYLGDKHIEAYGPVDAQSSFDACDQLDARPVAGSPVGAQDNDQIGAQIVVSSPKNTTRKTRSRRGGARVARATVVRSSKRLSMGRKPAASTPVLECDLACNVCGMEFRNRESLTRHSRKHRGLVKKCEVCQSILGPQKQNLTRHMRAVHGMNRHGEPLTQEELDEHLCDFKGCTQRFTRDDKLRDHMTKKHPHRHQILCEMTRNVSKPIPCKFYCFTKEKMYRHQLKVHHKNGDSEE